jgi:iron complex transport system ATP-binding protein
MSGLKVTNLSLSITNKPLLRDVSLSVAPGEFVAILGANGAGKSTLLKAITGLQAFHDGAITWNEESLSTIDPIARAKVLSYLPQERPSSWPILVRDVVALGRYAYGVNTGKLSDVDLRIVRQALQDCDLTGFETRQIDTLSGGENARVHCARTFASEAAMILADEPTTSLDPKHQLEVLQLLRGYVSESRCVAVVLHDPALAARFADRLVWMRDGRIHADGTPEQTLNPKVLAATYDIQASVNHSGKYVQVEFYQPL